MIPRHVARKKAPPKKEPKKEPKTLQSACHDMLETMKAKNRPPAIVDEPPDPELMRMMYGPDWDKM